MNYQPKNNSRGSIGLIQTRHRNPYRTPLQIVAGIVFLSIILRLIFPNLLSSFFTFIFAPLWHMENAVSADDFFATHASLVAQNNQLQDQINAFSDASGTIALLEQENAELKEMLGRPVANMLLTLAAVLKIPPFSGYDNLIIDIGSNEGIKVGDKVFASLGPTLSGVSQPVTVISSTTPTSTSVTTSTTTSVVSSAMFSSTPVLAPIGTILEISPTTSKVQLFSSPGQSYQVQIGPDHIVASAVAQGGGIFEAELSQGVSVNVGDVVTIPNIETLMFGTIGTIIDDPARPYVSVLFSEPVNIYQLRWVEVDKGQ